MSESSPVRPPESQVQCYRFGLFEADPRSGELRRNGIKVRLQEQPFQVLMVLLERPGEVVSRDELQQRLWSNDTFVDFDHGLNTAINKLREAVGDKASNPRFIETLARRGYRFIAPVQRLELPAAACQPPLGVEGEASEAPVPHICQPLVDVGAPTPQKAVASASSPAGPAVAIAEPGSPVDINEELPRPHRGLTRLLFGLAQLMYLIFYVVAMVRIEYIRILVDDWRTGYGLPVMALTLVTASIGVAIRLYLLTAIGFDYRLLGRKFRRIFPLVLPLDQLWALAPFLLLPEIGVGAAFAACAALLYLPFSERTLIRMAYESW